MSENIEDLVADTRDHAAYMRRVWGDDAEVRDDSRLFDRLADALEAKHKRAEELYAVIEAAEDWVTAHYLDTQVGEKVLAILSRIPEHDDKEQNDA